jgi:hypothetical protein
MARKQAGPMTVHFGAVDTIDAPSERHFGSIQTFGQLLLILGIN